MWPKAISMIAAGDLPIDDIISHTFPLKDFKKGIDQVNKTLTFNHQRIWTYLDKGKLFGGTVTSPNII